MIDQTVVGTMRETVLVEVYHAYRWRDGELVVPGPPDETITQDRFYEADGTIITDDDRIARIVAAQDQQREGSEHVSE